MCIFVVGQITSADLFFVFFHAPKIRQDLHYLQKTSKIRYHKHAFIKKTHIKRTHLGMEHIFRNKPYFNFRLKKVNVNRLLRKEFLSEFS